MPANTFGNSPYSIRNFHPSEFDKYVLLLAEAEKLEPAGRCASPMVVADQLEQPNHSPEQDLFILWSNNIAGYLDVKPEPGIGRVVLDCWVHPEHRRKGLAAKLLNCATNRAKELGAKVVHVNIREDNVAAMRALHGLGFSVIRRYLELGLDVARVGGLDKAESDPDCRYLQPGEEVKLTQLQNCAFAGSWGYNPNTVEEIAFRINSKTSSRDDIILIYRKDKAIGYCWTGISCEEGKPSMRKGRILMLGVLPDYRCKGIGKKSLLAGLVGLRNKGLQVAELTVDSENKAACALYQSIGFEIQANTLWYEKVIN
jgi:mycothiol synthase